MVIRVAKLVDQVEEDHELSHVLLMLLLPLHLELLPLCYGIKAPQDPCIVYMELVITVPIVLVFLPLYLAQLNYPLRYIF